MENLNKHKLWTKDFIIITTANFFVSLIFYLLMTTMAMYAMDQFRASQSKAGLATSIFVIGALFARLLIGKYIEVIGRKKLIYGGLVLFLISSILYLIANTLTFLMVVRFFHGVAFGTLSTSITTAAVDLIPPKQKGEGTGYFSLGPTAATAIGPFIGLFIMQHADFNMIFISCTLFTIICIILTLFVEIPEADITESQKLEMKKGFKFENFFEKKAFPISLFMILMGVSYSGIVSFLNSYAKGMQLTDAVSYFYIIYAALIFLFRPYTGKLLDSRGANIVMYPGITLFSLCLLLLSISHNNVMIFLAGVLLALGYGTLITSAQTIAVKISPKHHLGLATSTFFAALDAGMGIGPYLMGLIIPHVGYKGMYLTLSIIVILSNFIYYLVHGRNASAVKSEMDLACEKTS